MAMRLAVPDLVSNSYFPAIAAVELGYMREEGLDIEWELMFPVTDAASALRDGRIDFLAGAAHAPFHVDPDWNEVRLVCAVARHTYWFLVVRPDLIVNADNLSDLRDVRIGAAPGPDLALVRLLQDAGVDLVKNNVVIAPVPGAAGSSVSFGVAAADALAAGTIEAFWANGMGTEVACRRGDGRVVIDARRSDTPFARYTFPALLTSRRLAEGSPESVAAAERGLRRAQDALRENPALATEVGERVFPAFEASLIADLVTRDLPYYDADVSAGDLRSMVDFARRSGLTNTDPTAHMCTHSAGK